MPTEPKSGDLAIGIDFGGSGIKGAVVDIQTGMFVGDRIRTATPQPSVPREVISVMGDQVRGLIEALGVVDVPAMPVGVGIPAATRSGTTLTAANIDSAWVGFPAEREMGLPSTIIGSYSELRAAVMSSCIVGSDASFRGMNHSLNIGDNTEIDYS